MSPLRDDATDVVVAAILRDASFANALCGEFLYSERVSRQCHIKIGTLS